MNASGGAENWEQKIGTQKKLCMIQESMHVTVWWQDKHDKSIVSEYFVDEIMLLCRIKCWKMWLSMFLLSSSSFLLMVNEWRIVSVYVTLKHEWHKYLTIFVVTLCDYHSHI